MPKYPKTRAIFVDVDGTLISHGRLNEAVVDYCQKVLRMDYDVVLWSARGRRYAEAVAKKHGLDFFTAIIGKPGYIIDDLGWAWINNTKVLTLEDIE